MNILVINGSPRMERSNSLRMTRAFLEGLAKTCDTQVEELTVAKMHIEPCLGCLNCWKRTPGKCFRDDDMAAAIESYVTADLVVGVFPPLRPAQVLSRPHGADQPPRHVRPHRRQGQR